MGAAAFKLIIDAEPAMQLAKSRYEGLIGGRRVNLQCLTTITAGLQKRSHALCRLRLATLALTSAIPLPRLSIVVICATCTLLQLVATARCCAFDFNDGTNQGWTSAGFYDDGGLVPIPNAFNHQPATWSSEYDWPNVPPDNSAPPNHGAISVGGDFIAPTSPTADAFVHSDLISPNLSTNPIWGEPTSFRFGLLGDILSATGAFNFVQVVWHVVKPDGEESYFQEFDLHNDQPIFHQVIQNANAWETIEVVHTLPEGTIVIDIAFRVFFEADHPYTGFIAIDEIVLVEIVSNWLSQGSGSWNDPTNWSTGRIPNGFDQTVVFGNVITLPVTVTLDTDVSQGELIFDNATHSYTLAGDNVHQLELAGVAAINVVAGSHEISAPIVGTAGLNKSGPGTLTVSGANSYSGETRVVAGTMIVQNHEIPGETIHVSPGATLNPQQFASYQLHPNQTLSGDGTATFEHSFSLTELAVVPSSAIRGSLTIQVDSLINSGHIAPGNSPGILTIDGDYIQENDGALEIEVGGLVPGSEHDQVVVHGNASLAGRLEVPIFGDYVPAENVEITFLTTIGENRFVEGTFGSILSPNLANVNPNLAMEILYNDPQNVRLRFVPASTGVQFVTQEAEASWTGFGTWTEGEVPDSTNIVTLNNLSGAPQQVNVTHGSAMVHQLNVVGQTDTIKLSIQNGSTFSATTGVTVENKAVVELVDQSSLVSSQVDVQPGGVLAGNGTVVGNLSVGGAPGEVNATLSPGLSAGHLEVRGNYEQGAGGTLAIEIDGEAAGQFDTMRVSGQAKLGGQLVIDASEFDLMTPGTTFAILEAGDLVEGAIFDDVKTIGNNNIFFAPIYRSDETSAAPAGDGLATGSNVGTCGVQGMCVAGFFKGDMNRNGMYDAEDIQKFALALTRPIAYFGEFGIFGHESGNIDGSPNGLDFDDIDDFAELIPGASTAAVVAAIHAQLHVPEPAAFVLFLLCGCSLMACRTGQRRRRR